MNIITYVCPRCKSENTVAEGITRWNVYLQQWEPRDEFTYDKSGSCDDCGFTPFWPEKITIDEEPEET